MLTQAFITSVEERVASPHRTTHGPAEVVPLQGSLFPGVGNERKTGCGVKRAVEVVARVKGVIAEVVEAFTMKPVCAGARSHRHNRAVAASVLRAESGVVDLELRCGADRRLEGDLVLADIVQIDPIDLEVH